MEMKNPTLDLATQKQVYLKIYRLIINGFDEPIFREAYSIKDLLCSVRKDCSEEITEVNIIEHCKDLTVKEVEEKVSKLNTKYTDIFNFGPRQTRYFVL